jgi:single-stranded-DNA-specific exonuclease
VELIVTVDCGITNHREVSYAVSKGIKVIITDHHEVPDILPVADAIVNPKLKNNSFPFNELSGAGFAFYLAIGTRRALLNKGVLRDGEINLRDYLDLVALGTICDIVPLVKENRIFTKTGLDLLSRSPRPGVMALKDVSGVDGTVSCGDVAFRLGPRINAGSRMADQEMGLKLLIENNLENAIVMAKQLNKYNQKRQEIEDTIFEEAVNMIESRKDLKSRKSIVLYKENWHQGIIGIVASRLLETYQRPVFLISVINNRGRGSGRSVPGINLTQCLRECSDLLEGFGGHKYAAGINIKKEKIPDFSERFEESVSIRIKDEITPDPRIDAEIRISDITHKLCQELKLLEPFGLGNPEPVLLLKNLNVMDARIVGDNHLSIKLNDGKNSFDGIGFCLGDFTSNIKNGIDVLCVPEINEWNGSKKLRLNIKQILGA